MFKTTIALFSLTLPLLVAGQACDVFITKFIVVDPTVSPPIFTDLGNAVDVLDYPGGLNVEAIVSAPGCESQVKCVKFLVDGAFVRNEKVAPYFMFGNQGSTGVIYSGTLNEGPQGLEACAYSNSDCETGELGCLRQTIDVTASAPTPSPLTSIECFNKVTGFEVVDTENPYNAVATPFTPPLIDLRDYATGSLNIFAEVEQCGEPIGCVKLWLGSQVREERTAPYALYGNLNTFIRSGTPALGPQKLKACTYSDAFCEYGESGCLEVDVFVQDATLSL